MSSSLLHPTQQRPEPEESNNDGPSSLLAVHPDQTHYGARLSATNPEHSDVAIVFSRRDRTYRPTELVEGAVVVTAKDGWFHREIDLVISGEVRLSSPPFSGRTSASPSDGSSLPETKPNSQPASDSSFSTRTLVERSVLLKPRGQIESGMHRLSFTFPLVGIGGEPLLETYKGKYIKVVYTASVCIERGVFSRTLEKSAEFAVRAHPLETPNGEQNPSMLPVPVRITPTSITENSVKNYTQNDYRTLPEVEGERSMSVTASSLPNFHVRGHFDSAFFSLDDPVTGVVSIVSSSKPVKSVEVRLISVESVCRVNGGDLALSPGQTAASAGGGFITSRTEVQTHRIAEGDVPRGFSLPVCLVLPRLLVCPTVASGLAFRIGWELDLRVLFFDGTMVTEAYPVELYRGN